MKKTYVNVCKILKCEGLDCEDGKIVMTEEQVQFIEDKMTTDGEQLATLQADIAKRDQEIADLKAQIEAKDAEIAEQGKKPAGETKQVNNKGGEQTTDDTNPELKGYCDDMAEAQKLLDQLKK